METSIIKVTETNIKPLHNRVLIEKQTEPTTTGTGIELVQYAKTTKNSTVSIGTIVAVADGVDLTVGASVVFDEGWGNEHEDGLFIVEVDAVKAYLE